MIKISLVFLLVCLSQKSFGQHIYADDDPEPTTENGAKVYSNYCSLCHGGWGMGDGSLAKRIDNYPSTDLVTPHHAKNSEDLLHVIAYGGVLDAISVYMPPYGKELSWSDMQSVALFVELLRADSKKAKNLLAQTDTVSSASLRVGKKIYEHRCMLCHGEEGEGDGRMAKVIKTPPPANLVVSQLDGDYLQKIIMEGGESVLRSPQMPPWRDELTASELESVILYIKSLRK